MKASHYVVCEFAENLFKKKETIDGVDNNPPRPTSHPLAISGGLLVIDV